MWTRTLDLYRRALKTHPNVGICLQAYLHRTEDDPGETSALRPSIRLVKGHTTSRPKSRLPASQDVDETIRAWKQICGQEENQSCVPLSARIRGADAGAGRFCIRGSFGKKDFEYKMLYGIQRAEQERLASEGCTSIVLVAYGSYWYPWFVRRLAERPANLGSWCANVFAA